jgi:lactate racemase
MEKSTYEVQLSSTQHVTFDVPTKVRPFLLGRNDSPVVRTPSELEEMVRDAVGPTSDYPVVPIVHSTKPVVIVIDDHTRSTPILPALTVVYEEIRRIGVTDEQITVLVSTGTHRPMSEGEVSERLGEFRKHLAVVQHDCLAPENLYPLGEIDGIPVLVNRTLKDAGTVIGIGSLVAHKFSGWSGTGKIICPGVAGYETIYRSHSRSIIEESIVPGQVDNWFRRFVDVVADRAGLSYCINFLPAADGRTAVVAGPPETVLKRGIEIALRQNGETVPTMSDLVIASAYPSTTDLWQSGKAIYSAEMVAKNGGTIVLVTPLDDGLGDHPDFLKLLNFPSPKIRKILAVGKLEDPLAAVAAYAVRRIADRCPIRIVTTNRTVQGQELLGQRIGGDLQKPIDEAVAAGIDSFVLLGNSYVLPQSQSARSNRDRYS